MSEQLRWEELAPGLDFIEGERHNLPAIGFRTFRAKVRDGWLVFTSATTGGTTSSGLTFLPDVAHAWAPRKIDDAGF